MDLKLRDDIAFRCEGKNIFIITEDNKLHIISDSVGFEIFKIIEKGKKVNPEMIKKKILEIFDVNDIILKNDLDEFIKSLFEKKIICVSEK